MTLTVGIGSFGTIGRQVARELDLGHIPGLSLGLVSAQDKARARQRMADFRNPVPVVNLAELAACDVVLEAAPAAVFAEVAEAAIEAGRLFIPTSVGALLPRMDLVERAGQTGARIIVPTGALLGLDAVRAVQQGDQRVGIKCGCWDFRGVVIGTTIARRIPGDYPALVA